MARSSLLLWGFSFYFVLVVLVVPIICQTPPGPPVITGPAIIRNGETVTITCSSTGGDPTPTVKWLRDNNVLDDTSTTSGGVTVNEYEFTATPAEHLGVFECQTDNGVLQNPLTRTLFVTVNISPQTPTLTGPSTLAANQQGTWTCTSTGGYPAPTMTMRIGNNQFSTSEFTTTSVAVNGAKSYTVTGTLIWSPTIGNNGQTLFCDVAHPTTLNTPQTVSLTLTVIAPLVISATPTFYNPTIGTSVTLNCVVTSGTATSITWLKDNSILNINGDARLTNGDVSTPSLSISNVQQSDSGNYICRAADVTGTVVSSNTITVTPQAPLAISATPTFYNPTIGTSVTLNCVVTSGTATSITWLKDNSILNINGDARLTNGDLSTPSLSISNVQQSDSGSYVCRAADATGTVVNSNTITVTPQGTPPVVTIAQPTYSQLTGQQITLGCTVLSNNSPLQLVQWTFTNQGGTVTDPIVISTSSPLKYSGATTSNPSLTVYSVTSTDQGTYRCRASNLIGTTTSNPTVLSVTGNIPTLRIPQNTYSDTYGNQVTIPCSITSATPSATYVYWTRTQNNNIININNGDSGYQGSTVGSPSLTINFATTGSNGVYKCFARNAVGTGASNPTTLTITGGLLSVDVSPNSANVVQGTNQQITCTVTGTPAATGITWTRLSNNQLITLDIVNSNGKYIGGTTSNPHLTISNFLSSDAGTYVCRATNAAGSQNSDNSVLTYIQPLTLTISPPSGTATYGAASYTIQCQISGTTASSWSWTKTPINGGSAQPITQGSKYSIQNSPNNPFLTISNIVEEDEADYACQATNLAGSASSSNSRLTVTGSTLTVGISPTSANVLQSTNQLVQCLINGQPSANNIQWQRTINGVQTQIDIVNSGGKYSGGTTGNPHITINNFQSSDAGIYVCRVTNAYGTATSPTSTLTYMQSLSITISPPTGTAIVGDNSYRIQCQISGTTASSWSWTKTPINGGSAQQITQGSKYSIQNSPTNPFLTINNIVEADEADYACQATNVAGSASSSNSRLIVNGGALSVSVTPTTQSAVIGDNSVMIQCTVSGIPQATSWYWTFSPLGSNSQTTIAQGTNNGDYTVSNSNTNPHLTIKTITTANTGDYICRATNVVTTSSSQQSRLTVTGAVLSISISPPSALVIQGTNRQIVCTVQGTPAAQSISWTRNGAPIAIDNSKYTGGNTANPSLTINNFQSSDAGNYVCSATNAAGTSTSGVSSLTYGQYLILTASPNSGSAVIGDASYVINCAISGSPTATSWYWVKSPVNGNAISTINQGTNNNKYTMGTNPTNPSLTIKSITQDDNANYRCQATNIAGERASNMARLLVTGGLLSVIVTPTQSSPNFGAASVTIQCSISGSPGATSVGWRKVSLNGQTSNTINAVNSNGKYAIASSTTNPDLTINNINFDDDANYVCFATNLVGSQNSGNARVDVIGSQPQVSIPSTAYSIIYGNDVTIPCNIINSNPAHTIVTWYRVDNNGQLSSINVGDLNQYSGGTLNTPALTIKAADSSDIGAYRCAATNIVGEGQSSNTRLTVVGGLLAVSITMPGNVQLGNQATLFCSVSGTPSATNLYWEKKQNGGSYTSVDVSGNSRYSGGSLLSPNLVITNAAFSDSGTYRCLATNAAGLANSIDGTLNVVGNAPTVQIASTIFPVLIGNQIILGCNVIANPAATDVYWIFIDLSNQQTTIRQNTNVAKYGGVTLQSPSLVLKSAEFSDEGKYTCYASNSIGTGNSLTADLDVTGKIPTVTIPLTTYSVDFGNQITIGCSVTSNPAHFRVFWRKKRNGITTDLNVANSNGKYSGSTTNNPSLVINNAALDDQASYVCYAENSVGTGSSTTTALSVTGNIPNVNILNTQYNVDYGNTVTLECTVTANPGHTSVYWQKIKSGVTSTIDASTVANDSRLSGSAVNTPSLTITNVNLNDVASYICFAQNSVGIGQSAQTSLVVSGGIPNVVILRNSYGVQVGSVVTLQCVVTADPAHTVVKWERLVNGQLQDVTNVGAVGSGSRLTGSQVDTPSLTINQVTFQDEGNYICTATNAVGTGKSPQTFLGVSGTAPVVTVPNNEYQGNFGQGTTMVCTVTANPTYTRVYWKKLENGVLSDVDMTSSKFSGSSVGQPSLTISNLNKNDQAFYQCYAENSVGTGKSQQTFLRVIGDIPTVQITSSSYSVTLGQNAVLGCTVTANPTEVSVSWKKYNSQNQLVDIDMTTNNNNKYQGSVVGTPSLTIIGTTSDDAGRYVCYAVNAVGTGSSGITTLNIDGAIPIVNIPQDTYSVNIGNQVTLACTVSATPGENNVYWTKKIGNGAETTITKSDATKYQGQTVQSPGLIILNTDFNDIATYICYATNAVGTGKSNPTNLQVIGSLPNVQIPQPSYSANYDQTATIPCTVIATPGITNVQWIKLVNGQEQNIDMTQAKYSGATTNNPSLTIANANLNDEAVYICTATNSVGTGRSQQSYLDVIGAIPVVAVGSNSYSVVKNQNKDLVCTIVATPAATNVQWYRYVNGVKTGLRNVVGKYNTPTVNSPNLRIFNADDQDRGYYLCTASNVVGTGTSQTTFLDVTGNIPIVTVAPLTYNGNIGGSVTIGCQVVANPAATSVYWIKSKNSQDTTISSTTSKYSFSTNNPSLTINNLSSDDEATYVCYATNSIGTGNSQAASLNIIGNIPQVTIPEQSYNSNIGSSVTLVCTVVANPTHNSVYWRRIETNGQVTDIAINNSKYQGATVANPSLTITNVQLADRLNYICFATNSVGTGQSSQTYLNVIGNPPVPTIGETTYSVPFGGSVEMGCTISSNPAHSVVFWKRIQNGVETLIDASYIANNQNKYGGGSLGTPSLTVKSADRNADQAFYECSATNAIGTGRSSRTFLTVTGDIPNVNIPENYYAVEISNNVVIPCNINSNPAHFSVTWQRRNNNGAISNLDVSDQTQYNNGNIGTPALTILNAQNADEGYYICTAANAVGTGSSSLTYIDVTGSILQVNVPQTSYNANYGQTIQLICSVTGTPAANDVYWIKIRNGVSTTIRQSTMDTNKYSGVTLGNPSLTIINANEADSAVYKCYGTNIVGTAESQQTQLIVIGSKPTVNVGPDKSVNLGNSVTLQCVVIATPSATSVQWNKITNGVSNRINVAANPTKYAGASTNTPSLTIYTAANSDQSSYTCQATNAAGTTVSSQTFLTVVGNLPIVTVTPDQQSITVGNPVTLGCSVQANPMHTTVVWKKMVNGVATDLPANSRYSGSTVSNPSLSITSVQSGDNGNYVCYATNSVGTGQSTQTSLNVVGSVPVVNVGSTTYSTNVGNRITLQCTVIANPPHTSVGWQRVLSNGNTQPIDMTNSRYLGVTLGSPSLIIDNTIKADEGNYVCIAANLVGSGQSPQTYLTVVGSTPTVTVPDPTYSVNRGSAITLECSFSANPPATQVRWRKNNVDLGDTAGNAKYGGSTTSSPSLIIYNAAESDEGSYQCTVTNSVGTGISTTTTLDVVGNIPVVSVATNTYNVNLGETVTLQCSVTADPLHTSVYWQKVTGGSTSTIIINNSKYEGSTVSNPSLTIKNAVSGDAGTYYCYATNSVGTGGSTQVVIGVTGNKPSVSLPRSANTANYGETVTIQCEVVANPAATSVYWQKLTTGNNAVTIDTSNTAKYGGATVASPSLIIRNLDSSDIANYICFAANSVGTGQSGQGSLNVIGSNPTVTMVKTAYTQNTGKNIVIGCTVTSSPAHTSVSWTRKIGNNAAETITATGGTKYSISSNINAPSLTIYNIQESDEGVYTCFATNVVGTGQSNPPARLNVIGNMPVVTASIPTTATRLGNPVTITCTVSANPVATRIFWQIINPGTNQGVNIDTSIAKYSGGTLAIPSLTINPVEESDEGNYQCLAENAIGTTKSNQVYLDTIGDPPTSVTVTPSPIVVEEGNMITATCTATGNPQPTFRWFRSTDLINPIDNDAVLNVLNAKESDKGSYVCRASNKFGTNDAIVTADVQFRPKVVIPDLTISGKKGLTAEIRCTQTSNPLATTLTWTKIVSNNAISTIAIDNNKYFGGNVLSPTLTITNLDASDEASYRCSATNAVGTGSSEIAVLTVDLSSPPIGINIYPNGITVLEGKDFSMYCNATGFPIPQYQWFHDDVMIREGQTYSISVSEYNAHDGLYTCKAYNSAGYLQKSIDVDVKYPPISNIKDNTFAPALNNPVTLQCDTLANPSAVQWYWYYGNIRLTDVPDNQKDYVLDMNNVNDYGEYNCVAFNEVGQSPKLTFTVTLDTPVTTVAVTTVTAVTTTQVTEPDTGETVSSSGLSGGEIAAICLGVLFFILLLIALIVCCILQGCCACCAVAAGKDKERRIIPDHEKLDIPRFYEVPTVVTREPSLISKRDVSLHMAPMYRPQNDYEINKYRVLRPDDNVDDRYVTSASRPYYLPAIEYTYDEEERRRRHRKKKKSRHHHDDLQRNEQIVLEERVVAGNDVYRTSGRSRVDDEVVTGPEFYFEAE